MMLFGEKSPLEFGNHVDHNLFATTHVRKEVEETNIQEQVQKEAQKVKTLIAKKKEYDPANVFNLNLILSVQI